MSNAPALYFIFIKFNIVWPCSLCNEYIVVYLDAACRQNPPGHSSKYIKIHNALKFSSP